MASGIFGKLKLQSLFAFKFCESKKFQRKFSENGFGRLSFKFGMLFFMRERFWVSMLRD